MAGVTVFAKACERGFILETQDDNNGKYNIAFLANKSLAELIYKIG